MKRIHLLLLSILSGVLLAISWPENGFNPIIFIGFVPLFFVQQHLGDNRKKGMFWYAWLAFLVWNVLTTWWVWYSTSVGSIFAMGLNSLFVAFVFYIFHLSKITIFQNKKGFGILIFYWISWEYFHMNWDLTWSWLNLGNLFASSPKWIQWYETTGTLGGTAWVLIANILIYNIIHSAICRKSNKLIVTNSMILIVLISIPVFYSYYLYNSYDEIENPIEVVVVQPNTDPYNEQYDLSPMVLLEKNLKLAEEKITENTRFVVFPESTLYDGLKGIREDNLMGSELIQGIKEFSKKYPQLSIVIGATTFRIAEEGEELQKAARKFKGSNERYYYVYNTALFIDSSDFIQIHHKSKLTPGVENMPSWGILKPIENLAINLGGTTGSLGTEKQPAIFTDVKDTKIAPIICYESVYGEFVGNYVSKGAQAIFVITNDGWWSDSPGHRQHFLFSVLRAIETRRSIARSANTGISAFINQRGDVFQKTEYWVPAVLRGKINMNDKMTYYTKNGDYIARISGFISALLLLVSFTQGILSRKKKLV